MIVLRDLVKQYKNKYALRGVNLHIQPGEFVFWWVHQVQANLP